MLVAAKAADEGGDLLLLRVGLTGGIATGKSTVSRMLRELGAWIVDADEAARKAVEPGQPAWHEVRRVFGEEYFLPNGQLDRGKLGELVFADEAARRKLESIIHPRVFELMEKEAAQRELAGDKIVVFDIPLLFETGYQKVDKTVVVYAPVEVQLERLIARNGLTRAEAEKRIAAQMPIEEKVSRADYVIDNSGSLESTRRAVHALWQRLVRLSIGGGEQIEDSFDCP